MKKAQNMDYEKAYKESFAAAKGLHDAGNALTKKQMEIVFHQLAESEGERTRKEIIHYLFYTAGGLSIEEQNRWIAYLEKQKEAKWSPSEGEMGVLYKLCYVSNQITDEDDTELTRLYQDLKREYFNGHSFENMFPSEKQKETHYTKRNAMFDKCVENCDPEIMKRVSDEVDAMLQKEQKPISSCEIVSYIDDKIAALQDMWREEKVAFDWDDMHEMIEDVARHFYQKEPKPVQSDVEREYVKTLKSLISDFIRGKEDVDIEYYQQIYDWLDGRHIEQKPAQHLPEEKVFDIMRYLTALSCSECIPLNSDEYGLIHKITEDVRSLLDYPIEQKAATWNGDDGMKLTEWSEEEKDKLNRIERLIVNANAHGNGLIGDKEAIELQHFIRSIVKPTTNLVEWSEEDNIGWGEAFACVTKTERAAKDEGELQNAVTAEKWLKEIKFKYYVHPKREWSEDDEETLKDIIAGLEATKQLTYRHEPSGRACYNKWIAWLKSLRPQPHWKPSEEQMKALLGAEGISRASGYSDNAKVLASLYEELKRLRG